MMLEEMLDLIDVVICTYNATSREALGHLSPLQVLEKIFERRAMPTMNAFSERSRLAWTSRSANDSHQTGGTIAAS